MNPDFEKTYHDVEKEHYWFKGRRNYIVNLVKKAPKKTTKILDIGCSSGILLNDLKEAGFNPDNLYGIDISKKAIENCKINGIQNSILMNAENIVLEEKFDIIIASDCLEHLEQDSLAIQNWRNLLKDNGKLIIFVPAFMFLWSYHDVANAHFRRYTKNILVEKIKEKGLKIVKTGYWNFLLFFPIFLVRIVQKVFSDRTRDGGSSNLSDPPIFNKLLSGIMYFENRLLKVFTFPIGVSTFCIAKK